MNSRAPNCSPLKRTLSFAAAASGLLLLSGCNIATFERAHYNVSEVDSFKTAGAPSRVMMLEVVDADNTFSNDFWSSAISNHGYAPRLHFVTDPNDIKDGETIKPENRMVVVVSPEQSTTSSKLCTDPQSVGMGDSDERVVVRFGFCVGDKIISETRGRFNRDQLAEQIENNADTVNFALFPRNTNTSDDHYCSPFLPNC